MITAAYKCVANVRYAHLEHSSGFIGHVFQAAPGWLGVGASLRTGVVRRDSMRACCPVATMRAGGCRRERTS